MLASGQSSELSCIAPSSPEGVVDQFLRAFVDRAVADGRVAMVDVDIIRRYARVNYHPKKETKNYLTLTKTTRYYKILQMMNRGEITFEEAIRMVRENCNG